MRVLLVSRHGEVLETHDLPDNQIVGKTMQGTPRMTAPGVFEADKFKFIGGDPDKNLYVYMQMET